MGFEHSMLEHAAHGIPNMEEGPFGDFARTSEADALGRFEDGDRHAKAFAILSEDMTAKILDGRIGKGAHGTEDREG